MVARFGGDEFTILLRGHPPAAGEEVARRLLAALDSSYEVGGVPVRCTVSAGAVQLPVTADLDELVRRADVAMYAAKAGSQTLVTYRPDLDTRTVADLARAERVRAGLTEGRLVLHYQPKVDLRDGAVRGVEALARLRDKDGTLLAPGQFLPELDRGGELTALTTQVLAQATAQAAGWRAAGTPLPVAINVPAPSLTERFGERVRDALARHDLPGELLYVEVTEESLLSDRRAARTAIEAVRALGVRVAVDDYGTGWSSLTYLRELPLDELKLRPLLHQRHGPGRARHAHRAVDGRAGPRSGNGGRGRGRGDCGGPRRSDRGRVRPGPGLPVRAPRAGGRADHAPGGLAGGGPRPGGVG